MTGRNPYRYGLQYSVILPSAPYGLSLEEKILPQYLSSAGYRSHMVGKWHLGSYQVGKKVRHRKSCAFWISILLGKKISSRHFTCLYLVGGGEEGEKEEVKLSRLGCRRKEAKEEEEEEKKRMYCRLWSTHLFSLLSFVDGVGNIWKRKQL